MSQKYDGLANAISSSLNKVNAVYLKCSNPVPQLIFDDFHFLPEYWLSPSIVAVDGSILAYYSVIDDRWHCTKIKLSWIDHLSSPAPHLLEIRGELKFFLLCMGS